MPINLRETQAHGPGMAEKVAFLSRPESYPSPPPHVEVVETHMSWVFLTDTYAYKLKKPVRYDYLDFSTLEARRRNCTEEVRLNRRLAANVYYGTVPLTIAPQGTWQLAGSGEPIEWLVKMRRLPAERMLDQAIAHHAVHQTEVRRVVALLVRFYTQTPPVAITPAVYRRRLAEDVRATGRELALPAYALPATQIESITMAQVAILEHEANLFDARVRAGRIIEAHGDLRPDHICLTDEPVIIDCLEFNRDLRVLDTVSELTFLALECERLGAPDVGHLILQTYCETTGDRAPERLLTFYKRYHACVRAQLALWHLKEPNVRDTTPWTRKAKHYLELASHIPSIAGRQ
jgi:aminoglycoside phosphotransferase family enzyme